MSSNLLTDARKNARPTARAGACSTQNHGQTSQDADAPASSTFTLADPVELIIYDLAVLFHS